MVQPTQSSGSSKIVTNVELDKEVEVQKKAMNEKTRLLDEAIEEMKEKLKEVTEESLPKEDNKGKKKVVSLEDEVFEPILLYQMIKNHCSMH